MSFYRPIYSTNQLLNDYDKYQNISNQNFKNSFKKDTKIINNIYNQMNNKDYEKNLNQNFSPFIQKYPRKSNMEFFENSNNGIVIKQNQRALDAIHEKQNNLSMLDTQFGSLKFDNPKNPVANNRKPMNINQKAYLEDTLINNDYTPFNNTHMIYDINRKNIFEYDPTIKDPKLMAKRMVHNNMVPFFSEKQAGESPDDYERYGNITTRKMNQFTGSLDNENYRPKTERRPLFNPMIGLTNIYGMPVKTEEYMKYPIPGRERRNEMPFQPVKVTPGLNLPYHAVSKVGFHDPYRILPKTIDELRTVDNPQISYTPPVKWGQISSERAVRPNVVVHKAPTFVENERLSSYVNGRMTQCLDHGARERLPTKAFYDKEKAREHFEVQNIATDNRGIKSTDWAGPLQAHVGRETVIGDVSVSRQNFEQPGPSNLGRQDTDKAYIMNRMGLTPDPTLRNTYNQEETGNIGNNSMNKGYTYDKNGIIPDITNRNTYNQEETGNIGSSIINKSYTYDKNGIIPDITNRNTYNQEETGNIGTNNMNKSYTYDKNGIIPDITNRNTYNQEETGNIGTNNMNKSYIYDKNGIIPDITNRNIYNQEETGNIGIGTLNKSYTYDKNGIKPDITNRNTYNQEETGNIGIGTLNKSYTYDKNGIKPDITNRNTYNQEETGNMGTSQGNKGYTYSRIGLTPDPTNRNIYNQSDHNGAAPVSIIRPTSRLAANNMYTNQSKDKLTINNHSPVPVKYFKTPSVEGKVLRMCKKLQIDRDIYPDINQQLVIGSEPLYNDVSINQGYTRPKQVIGSTEWHFLTNVEGILQGNPYINNTQHKSIGVLNNDVAPLVNVSKRLYAKRI